MNKSILCILMVIATSFTGCMDDSKNDDYYPDIKVRHTLDWNMTHTFSKVLEPGPHYALEVQDATFTVDTSDVWESGPSEADVHLSYWLPSNTLEGEQVPVIAIISPYFSYGQPGDESGHTGIVVREEGNLFTKILFLMVMLLHKSPFLELSFLLDVLIIEVQVKA